MTSRDRFAGRNTRSSRQAGRSCGNGFSRRRRRRSSIALSFGASRGSVRAIEKSRVWSSYSGGVSGTRMRLMSQTASGVESIRFGGGIAAGCARACPPPAASIRSVHPCGRNLGCHAPSNMALASARTGSRGSARRAAWFGAINTVRHASRSMTAGRSCIDSSTPSVTGPLMSCSTRWTLSPASSPLKCRSRSELARSSRESSPISPPATPASSTTPAHRRSMRRNRNPRPPHLRRCPDCARGCTTAPLRLAACAPRHPLPS